MPGTPEEVMAAVTASMEARTSRSLEAWFEITPQVERLLRVAYEQNG